MAEVEVSAWLKERKGFFDDLVEAVEDYAIFTMNPEGRILDWNTGAQRLKQYRAEEIIGEHFSRFYSEEDIAAGLPARELEIAGSTGRLADEGWRYRKDGSRFWASVTITRLSSPGGKIEGFLKITRDLTERHLHTEELRRSEEHFRLLVEAVSDYAIFMLSPQGEVQSWNTGARNIKGYTADEIIGRHFSVFYPEDKRSAGWPQHLLQEALLKGSVQDVGWRIRKDGTRFWSLVLITAVHDQAGVLRGFAKITRDLTASRDMEEMARIAKRKDIFLATLAHELRNPLAPMLPGLEVILKSEGDWDRVQRVAAILHRQVKQLSRLVADLVDFSRITTGKITLRKERITLGQLVETAVETIQPAIEAKAQQLTLNVPEQGLELEADLTRLCQALSNLLSNASRYTPEGGNIWLTAAPDATREHLEIRVRDNGVGIPLEHQGSIFELFERGDRQEIEGLGIGLSVVRTLCEMHGGSISMESAGRGKGSEFRIRLPL